MARLLSQNSRLIVILVFTAAVNLFSDGAGGLGGAYLRAPYGALSRINGTAYPDYISIPVNPARIAFDDKKELVVNGGLRSLGRREGSLSWEYGLSGKVGVGIASFYRGDASLDNLKTENQEEIDDGYFSSINTYVGGRIRFNRHFSFGISGKFIYINMPTDFNSSGELTYSKQFDAGGLDIGVGIDKSEKISFGLTIRNLFGVIDWTFEKSNDQAYTSTTLDTLPSALTAGLRYRTNLREYPFTWNSDIVFYIINSYFSPLEHKFALLNNGFRWSRFEHLHILAGIDNILLNYNLFKDSDEYADEFHPVVRLGMNADLSGLIETDLSIAYSISNDKVWAGVDQKLDLIFNF